MPNKELTARVRLDASQAHKTIDKLVAKVNKINAVVNKSSGGSGLEKKIEKALLQQERLQQATLKTKLAEERLTTQKNKSVEATNKAQIAERRLALQTERTKTGIERINKIKQQSISKTTSIRDKVRQWARNQSHVTSATKSTNNALSGIWSKLKGIAATYLGIMGGRALIQTSDIITSAQNRLNTLNGGDKALTQEHMDKMYTAANNARMAYTDMLSNASKSMTLAPDAFQGNMDNAIRFQGIMAKTYALGGAEAGEMSSSMYQLIQALGSGSLAGDELRSVREGAPLAYQAIEKYVQGVMAQSDATKDYATKSLKDIAADGLVTSNMVVAAVMNAGSKIDTQFENTAVTFGQAWDRIKSSAVKAFEPVSNKLSEMLNKAVDNGMFEKIENAFNNISKVLQIAFELISRGIAWIADNWSWLQHLIVAGLIIMATMWIYQGAMALISCVNAMIAMGAVTWCILVAVAAVLALVYIFILWKTGAINTCQAIVSALIVVGVAIALIGLLAGSWITAIVGLVIAAIGVIIHFLDYFLAIVYSIGAGIYNLVIGVLDGIIQLFWSLFVEPIAGIIEWFVNAWNGGFTSAGGAFANFCGQILSGLIGILKPFTKILDALFGWDTTGAIKSAQNSMRSWGKSENAVSYTVEAPTTSDYFGMLGIDLPDRISYSDAWDTGMKHGAIAQDWIAGLGSEYQTGLGDLSIDSIGESLGLEFGNIAGAGNNQNGVADSYNAPSPNDLLGEIAGDTGKISDSMDLTEEDLSYLREIANMEWKKEFTTASIVVDMKNNNTVNGDGDLDGIVTRLADKLYEEMDYLANGVYS